MVRSVLFRLVAPVLASGETLSAGISLDLEVDARGLELAGGAIVGTRIMRGTRVGLCADFGFACSVTLLTVSPDLEHAAGTFALRGGLINLRSETKTESLVEGVFDVTMDGAGARALFGEGVDSDDNGGNGSCMMFEVAGEDSGTAGYCRVGNGAGGKLGQGC
ncbi:hypothetical protein QAD02_011788 [Eretmocerus hayati]|uniref:Uncharacterized protein n=1 Tax=Eretmocerus hayati TaxID=131215 RepID=A0ACC2P0N8_9HYME|nr:hypothetical protein QAD02_011788 [Eretmocerus hayati]